jgi:nucleotide-binding universal stress UspA family protein
MDDGPMLICYDGSPDARRAIGSAVGLLSERQAVVLDIGPPLTVAESYASLGPVIPSFEEENQAEALSRAVEGAEYARQAGLAAEARGGIAAPTWEGIVDVADEIDAAVIVMGSRGLTGAREVLEGSLSHQVAEHAGRPVLIVPPPRRA